MESLWMGVPVIGHPNPKKAGGRIFEMISRPLELDGWVARSIEEYCSLAVQWAGQPDELTKIRYELRPKILEIFSRFPKDIEKSYRLIWQRWCKGEKPSPLYPLEM